MCDNNRKRACRLDRHHDTIVQMLKDDVPRADIADTLAVHLNTLKRYIARHELNNDRRTGLTDKQKTWLKDHYDGTASIRNMARTTGIERSVVYNYLVREGIHKPESRRNRTRIRTDVLSGRWGC